MAKVSKKDCLCSGQSLIPLLHLPNVMIGSFTISQEKFSENFFILLCNYCHYQVILLCIVSLETIFHYTHTHTYIHRERDTHTPIIHYLKLCVIVS